jgi:hypothetical protein
MTDILKIPFAFFSNKWNDLQNFLEKMGNPPYIITDNLSLFLVETNQSLGNLTSVEGWVDLEESGIKSLGNLTSVGGSFNWAYCNIKSLGNLTSVGGHLFLYRSKLEDLGNLTSVGGDLGLTDSSIEDLGKLKYVGGDLDLRFTPVSKIYVEEEIRRMVDVKGKVYL